jgi:hypothetical protein
MKTPSSHNSGTGSPLDWDFGQLSKARAEDIPESASAQELSRFLSVRAGNSLLGRPSWTQDEVNSIVWAYLGLMSANNWASLGNSSEIIGRENVERFFGALGFVYQDDLHERPLASTAITLEPPNEVGKLMENLFDVARNEVFEDGMESQFSKEFVSLLWRYGQLAILEAARLIAGEKVDPSVAAEALKWIGRMKDKGTRLFRLWLLKRGLTSSSAQVRDGAGLGLSFLGDPEAIPALAQAVDNEQIPELRNDLNQVIEQLRYAA